jgi:glutathione S-transferase
MLKRTAGLVPCIFSFVVYLNFIYLCLYCFVCVRLQLVGNTTEHIAQEVRDKNGLEQIPVLEFTDQHSGEQHSLTQSLAIIEYLEEVYPEARKVFSTCPLRRARARQVRYQCVYRAMSCIVPTRCFDLYAQKILST